VTHAPTYKTCTYENICNLFSIAFPQLKAMVQYNVRKILEAHLCALRKAVVMQVRQGPTSPIGGGLATLALENGGAWLGTPLNNNFSPSFPKLDSWALELLGAAVTAVAAKLTTGDVIVQTLTMSS
jgi:hypothetical protein